jgi:hypothetical protein
MHSRHSVHWRRHRNLKRALAIAGVFTAAAFSPCAFAASEKCTAPKEWFPHSQTPRPDDAAFESTGNCVFHQWSWQMFLWLTQDVDGKPRFVGFQSPQSLLGLKQRQFLPRMSKSPLPESLDEYLQAGTDGIMVDLQGRAVYYSQYINDTFADFMTSHDLTDPAKVQALDPNTAFPISGTRGAMELKASWKIVSEGDDVSDMFTMSTEVARLVNQGGKILIDETRREKVEVALVGLHIAGIVKGHPEMIWATFEHKRNAPNVIEATCTAKNCASVPPGSVISDEDFTFYKAGTTYANCNQNPASTDQLKLDEATQTLTPSTQACRQFEFGNDPSDASTANNDKNIADLNDSVDAQLDPKNVFRNYSEVGAIWFLDGSKLKPGMALATDDNLTGSLKLSNATIETFTQTQSVMNNCFRCHNTEQTFPPRMDLDPLKATNLNISHAFQNIYFWSQELSQGESK